MKNHLIAFYFTLPVPLVSIMLSLGISEMETKTLIKDNLYYLIACTIITYCLYIIQLLIKSRKAFQIIFPVSFALHLVLSIVISNTVHKDFYTYSFEVIGIYYLIFLMKLNTIFKPYKIKELYKYLYVFSLVLFAVIFEWMILMGYSISTHIDPHWPEAIVYNIYNLSYAFILVYFIIELRGNMYRQLVIKADSVTIDNQPINNILSDAEITMLKLLLEHKGDSMNCCKMRDTIPVQDCDFTCKTCIEHNYRVTECKAYKYFYNRIHNIRRVLDDFKIGSILLPANKQHIKESGWSLHIFDNIHTRIS